MAVDFAYKRRVRGEEGSAIRNIKLRMSRKLIYVSGLLVCFACHLELSAQERGQLFAVPDAPRRATEFFRTAFRRTPLEILCGTFLRYPHLSQTAGHVLNAYNGFLGVLADAGSRRHLESLRPESQEGDSTYQQLRQLSHEFRDGVLELFFDAQSGLFELTKIYGVF